MACEFKYTDDKADSVASKANEFAIEGLKQLLTLGGALLVLSITFLKDIPGDSHASARWLFLVPLGWGLLFFSLWEAWVAIPDAARALGTGQVSGYAFATGRPRRLARWAQWSFFGGLFFLALFSLINLGCSPQKRTTDTSPPKVAIRFPTVNHDHAFYTSSNNVTMTGLAIGNAEVTNISWTNDRGGTSKAEGTSDWTARNIALFDGTNVITITAYDAAKNNGDAKLNVCYDTTPPSVKITSPTPGGSGYISTRSSVNLAGTASDDVAIARVVWANDRGGTHEADGTTAWKANEIPLAIGRNVITVTAYDPANNHKDASLTVIYDTTQPTINISAPSPRQFTCLGAVTINGTANDDVGVARVEWVNNREGIVHTALGTSTWIASDIQLMSGDNVITFTAYDAANNHKDASVIVVRDQQAPNVHIERPASPKLFTNVSTITLIGTADDNEAVAKVEWSNSRGPKGAADGTNNWIASDIALSDGENVITAIAYDAAGNRSLPATVAIGYITKPPKVLITSPPGLDYISAKDSVVLEGSADSTVGLADVRWSNNRRGTGSIGRRSRWGATVSLLPGANVISVTAYDVAGNRARTSVNVRYSPAPAIAVLEPTTGPEYVTDAASVTLAGIASDNGAISKIHWASNRGEEGNVDSSNTWTTGDIRLLKGKNVITLTPKVSDGRQLAAKTLKVICTAGEHENVVDEIGEALDQAQNHLDEYGTISITAPVLTYARSNEFLFALTNGATTYFNDAKGAIQGRAASFTQSSQLFSLEAQGQFDPTVSARYAADLRNYAQQSSAYQLRQETLKQAADAQFNSALARAATNTDPAASNQIVAEALQTKAQQVYGSNGPPVFPLASAANTNLPAALANPWPAMGTNAGALLPMLAFQGLLNNIPSGLSVSDRSALITAAGDSEIESFFRALGNSSLFHNFINSEIYFGLVTVSINPGWRTKKNWAGEVNVSANLEFKQARRETVLRILDDPVWPVRIRRRIAEDYNYPYNDAVRLRALGIKRADEIASSAAAEDLDEAVAFKSFTSTKPVQTMIVSPLIESQTLDLADSTRLQTQMALSLAAAVNYPGASGAAKAFEQFAKSRQYDAATRTPLAMVNAFGGQDGSFGFQIGPRFQALANPTKANSGPGNILDRQAFPAVFVCGMSHGDIEPRLSTNSDGTFVVIEPYLAFHQTRRWVPLKRSLFSTRDWYMPANWYHPRLKESERVETADDLEHSAKLIQALGWASRSSFSGESFLTNSLRDRVDSYERQLVGTINYVTLAQDRMVPDIATEQPVVTAVEPDQIDLDLRLRSNGDFGPTKSTFILHGTGLEGVGNAITSFYTNVTDLIVVAKSSSAIAIQALITNIDYPLVFRLSASSDGNPILSPPVVVRPTLPQVFDVFPSSVTLKRSTNGSPVPTNVDIWMGGLELTHIDAANSTVASGYAALAAPVQQRGEELRAILNVTNAGQAVSLWLPVRHLPGSTFTNYILSRSVQIDIEPPSTNSAPKQSTNAPTLTVVNYALLPVNRLEVSAVTNVPSDALQAAAVIGAAATGQKWSNSPPAVIRSIATDVSGK